MALTMALTLGVTLGGKSLSNTISLSNTEIVQIEESVANGQTDYVVNLGITIAKLVGIVIVSDQNVTLKTNSSGAPAETLALVANQPYLWFTGALWVNLLATNLTSLHLANASGSAANFYLYALIDGS